MRHSYKRTFYFLTAICFCLLPYLTVIGQKQLPYGAPPLFGDSIKAGKTITVQDTVFFNTTLKQLIAETKQVDNIISFHINEYANSVMPDTFRAELRIQTDFIDANLQQVTKLDTLVITYSKRNVYNGKDIRFYKNYYSAQVKVITVIITAAALSNVMPLLELENNIAIDRSYVVNCAANNINTVYQDPSSVAVNGELKVSWPS